VSDAAAIKCVVWDLDDTLVEGVLLERPDRTPPRLDARMLELIERLDAQGIVNSVASRNPPEVLDDVLAAAPSLRERLVAAQLGWGRKSDAIRRVAAALDVALDAIAFVDDDPFERAEVQGALPDVLVLDRDEIEPAAAAFADGPVTEEARRRSASYRANAERSRAAAAFADYEDFLRTCDISMRLATATAADAERLAELAARTHQYNSTGAQPPAADFARAAADPGAHVATVRVRDRFGDDGLVGASWRTLPEPGVASLDLVMVSCRAALRGVVRVLLTHALDECHAAGARVARMPLKPTARNVPLRLTLREYGFTVAGEALFERDLAKPYPGFPDWVSVER
jgi:methoxymalonate biosynthesis protein